jgi:hypothetical protein
MASDNQVILEEDIDEAYEPTDEGARRPAAAQTAANCRRCTAQCARRTCRRRRASPLPGTPAEIVEYARAVLGMEDVERERGLLHIARDGLRAPLPAHWRPWCARAPLLARSTPAIADAAAL